MTGCGGAHQVPVDDDAPEARWPQNSQLHQTLYRHLPAEIRDIPINRGGALGVILFKARRRFFPELDRSLLVDPASIQYFFDSLEPVSATG